MAEHSIYGGHAEGFVFDEHLFHIVVAGHSPYVAHEEELPLHNTASTPGL